MNCVEVNHIEVNRLEVNRAGTNRVAIERQAGPTTRQSEQEFELLYRRSQRYAYCLAYRLTGNKAEAEDVIQDAYLRAWSHFDSFDHSRSFEGWLARIITNRVIDLHRRQKRRMTYSLDSPTQLEEQSVLLGRDLVMPDSDPAQALLQQVGVEELEEALCALSDHHRKTLLLFAVEQRSYDEIAAEMQCAPGTIRSRIHRARGLLARHLASIRQRTHRLDA
jgi:RNA polymerase sigma-70 factor, ECF subfamily